MSGSTTGQFEELQKRLERQRARELEELKHDNAILKRLKHFYETHELRPLRDWRVVKHSAVWMH